MATREEKIKAMSDTAKDISEPGRASAATCRDYLARRHGAPNWDAWVSMQVDDKVANGPLGHNTETEVIDAASPLGIALAEVAERLKGTRATEEQMRKFVARDRGFKNWDALVAYMTKDEPKLATLAPAPTRDDDHDYEVIHVIQRYLTEVDQDQERQPGEPREILKLELARRKGYAYWPHLIEDANVYHIYRADKTQYDRVTREMKVPKGNQPEAAADNRVVIYLTEPENATMLKLACDRGMTPVEFMRHVFLAYGVINNMFTK